MCGTGILACPIQTGFSVTPNSTDQAGQTRMSVLLTAADYPFSVRACKAENRALNSARPQKVGIPRPSAYLSKQFLLLVSRRGFGTRSNFRFLFTNRHTEFYLYFPLDASENLGLLF